MDTAIIRAVFQLNSLHSTTPKTYKTPKKTGHKNEDTIQGLFFAMLFCQNLITAQDLV